MGAAVAIAMVEQHQRARAMAVMIGGLSIANVLGVPVGAFLGEQFGWRSAFWAVAAASAIALVGILTLIPRIPLPEEKPTLSRELRIYRDRQVWLSIGVTALAAGGVFCAFSYLSPLLTEVAGLDSGWVPWILGLFGVGALLGTTLGGRIADANLFGVMLWGITASTVFLTALALLASTAAAAIALSFLLGFSAFFTAPALNARMFNVAGAAPTLAGATTTAAFNLGNTGGPWLGGTVIDMRLRLLRHRLGGCRDDRHRDRAGPRRPAPGPAHEAPYGHGRDPRRGLLGSHPAHRRRPAARGPLRLPEPGMPGDPAQGLA